MLHICYLFYMNKLTIILRECLGKRTCIISEITEDFASNRSSTKVCIKSSENNSSCILITIHKYPLLLHFLLREREIHNSWLRFHFCSFPCTYLTGITRRICYWHWEFLHTQRQICIRHNQRVIIIHLLFSSYSTRKKIAFFLRIECHSGWIILAVIHSTS